MIRIKTGLVCLLCLTGNVSFSQETEPVGYILSMWHGFGYGQTHSVAVFEGEDAKERCERAAKAMRAYDQFFNNENTKCVPF